MPEDFQAGGWRHRGGLASEEHAGSGNRVALGWDKGWR